MKIVFFGSPESAVYSLKKIIEEGHHVELIITQPDKPSGRGKKLTPSPVKNFAQALNIPVYQPEKIKKDPLVLDKLKGIDPDLNVVVAYGQIIPASLIYLPRYNSINLHFSLLPKYRGAAPVHWSILNGDKITGVTIFELNEKMDSGDLLAKQELEILIGEYAHELEIRLAAIGAELLCKTIKQIDSIPHTKQDHSQATFAPLLKKEDGRIDWTKRATEIDRKIRAFTPWPSAFSFLDQKRIKVIRGKILDSKPHVFGPGEILGLDKAGIRVSCGKNSIYLIEELQPEGKKSMNAYAFTLGAQIYPGTRLH
ncbi:MAG: methionyl-tRNA formyltransferase [Candidatus Aminicenantes bacterium]|nr:MAG: methionyl-tRNA formyltransferase [Candidatus Aminicenantes bacterium]